MTRNVRHSVLLLVMWAITSALPAEQQPAPSDREQGRKLFVGHCAYCHGIDGSGGRGPALNHPRLLRAADDKTLFDLVKNGLPGGEMPGAWQMSDREIERVVVYVRSLGRTDPVTLAGSRERGKTLYESTGACIGCHMVNGRGGNLGPDLTDVGARRGADYLMESLVNPGATAPDRYLVVTVVAKDGRRIRGVRVNEDSFTIQMRDLENRFYSMRKADLVELSREFGVSTMPEYRSLLSTSELEDLVAYMAGLRGDL